MKTRATTRAITFVGLLALAGSAQAQIVTEMTPERIAEAIAAGKDVGKDGPKTSFLLKATGGKKDQAKLPDRRPRRAAPGSSAAPGDAPEWPGASFSTPFSRVAWLAADAKAKYTTLDPAQIPPEVWPRGRRRHVLGLAADSP